MQLCNRYFLLGFGAVKTKSLGKNPAFDSRHFWLRGGKKKNTECEEQCDSFVVGEDDDKTWTMRS